MGLPTGKAKDRRPIHKRSWFRAAVGAAGIWLVCVGPWPVRSGPDESLLAAAYSRIAELPLGGSEGPLWAGVAVREITPPVGEPLAGFSGRRPKASHSVRDRLYAKAVSLSNGRQTVTILSADLLLVLPDLREEVLGRLGLPREEVYFTATHTHSGPGGYGRRWIEEIFLGPHDPEVFDRLAGALAGVVADSRRAMVPADLTIASVDARPELGPYALNRLEPNAPAHERVLAMLACSRQAGPSIPLAAVVIASPHPTCLGQSSHQVSADYPGVVQEALQEYLGCPSLFAIGSPGSIAPAEPRLGADQRLEAVGRRIAQAACAALEESPAAPRQSARIAAAILPVELPAQQYRISRRWRLSPIAASYIHGRQTYIHALRIDGTVLLGMPGDYSGELALRLESRAAGLGVQAAVTSCNGDYVGYLLPASRYDWGEYEASEMSLFGPWAGEYLNEVAAGIMRAAAESGLPSVARTKN